MKWLILILAFSLTACSGYESSRKSNSSQPTPNLGLPAEMDVIVQEFEVLALKAELELQSIEATSQQIIDQLQNLGISKAQCEAALAEVKNRSTDIQTQIPDAIAKIDDALLNLDPNDPDQAELIDLLNDVKARLMALDFNALLAEFQTVCDGL